MYVFKFYLFLNFTILYWFCQILKWIRHRYTCVPHLEPFSLLPPHTIPLGHPSAPAPSIQYHASNLDWQLVSYMILYMFQCHSPKSSHPLPLPLPQSPKDCSIHQCLFCCLVHRVIVTIFLVTNPFWLLLIYVPIKLEPRLWTCPVTEKADFLLGPIWWPNLGAWWVHQTNPPF